MLLFNIPKMQRGSRLSQIPPPLPPPPPYSPLCYRQQFYPALDNQHHCSQTHIWQACLVSNPFLLLSVRPSWIALKSCVFPCQISFWLFRSHARSVQESHLKILFFQHISGNNLGALMEADQYRRIILLHFLLISQTNTTAGSPESRPYTIMRGSV